MFRKTLLALAAFSCAAAPACAGGGGPVSITRVHGSVQIREIDWKTGKALGPWRQTRTRGLIGSYLLRTGRGSFAHLELPFRIREGAQWRYVPEGCVDSGSLVRIESYADSMVRVVRGRISITDGKRLGRLPSVMGGL
jgi:hypothetical protein